MKNPFAAPNPACQAGSSTVGSPDLRGADLLHQFFEHQAQTRPNAIALACAGQNLTYSQLEGQANQLARWLRRKGVTPGDCVALLLPRSTQVYVALLGILKAGAAYVPLDPEYPAQRVGFILADCGARILLTTSALANKAAAFAGILLQLDGSGLELTQLSTQSLSRNETGTNTEDLCYVIYTSGTTGNPKGVQIEHRSVCHLVRAEAQIFQVQPQDRVYQGFSIAFDASVEEVWLAFFAGATLVVGTQEMVHAGPGLSRLLTEAGVTILSCVPTLLAMMDEDVPSLRLLILGGEACPPELVKRWWQPGRRLVNTYGPTEATVIATYAECHPERPVTIGRTLPERFACIVNEQLEPITDSSPGELCLGGMGLARGYLGRLELTREKFIYLNKPDGSSRRVYRTGDLVRWTASGEIEFLGRIDTQVKIRGFRVELSEIEAALTDCPEVRAAAVSLREDVPGVHQLVAYVVPRSPPGLDPESVRNRLRTRLPAYMMPALLEPLAELPTLPSGKIDRKNLPVPRSRSPEAPRPLIQPRTALEQQLAQVWQRLLAPQPVSVRDDFFLDLGGHSLLAARMVSELRRTAAFAQLSMLDVYQHPTIEALAAKFEQRLAHPLASSVQSGEAARRETVHSPTPFWRHFWCGAAQLASLGFVLSFFALQWLTPYLTYTILIEEDYEVKTAILGAFLSLVAFYPLMLTVPIAVKWLVIGRYKPGVYPLWGSYYFRWWLVTTIEAAVPVGYLAGTPLLNLYCRLMGARIGRNVHLSSDNLAIYDLVSIGEDSSINVDSQLLGYTVEHGLLKLGGITIGKRCYVGARATVNADSVMEDDSALEELSLLPTGATIPRGASWAGSPAHDQPRVPGDGRASEACARPAVSGHPPSLPLRCLFGVLHGLGVLVFPVLVAAALFPGIVLMNKLNYIDPYYWYLLLAPLVGLSFVVLLCLEIAAVKWLLLGKVKPGRHRVHSLYYLRKWFVDQTMALSLETLGPLYASVYLAPWYKLLGAKLGDGAEISTASFISPDLLWIGAESFIADNVSLGAPRVRDGFITLGENRIGDRSFIGNSALLPPGTVIGDNVLIGCLSLPPSRAADAQRFDTAWLGSPAVFLPQRQKSTTFSEQTTFRPSAKLQAQRTLIEFVRVITPSTGFIILISLMFSLLLLLHDSYSVGKTLLFFPFLYLGCGGAATLLTILAKWILAGRYRPGERPLWSTFVWRNELVNALHEHLAQPFLVWVLAGTPFLCWYFRLLGARIGRRIYMETMDLTEFDLVNIGDEVALNADCTIQTHLFEDRVMKMSHIYLAPQAQIGAGSLVLYDTQIERGASLGNLSLLMKNEILPAGTCWEGIPARPAVLRRKNKPVNPEAGSPSETEWSDKSSRSQTDSVALAPHIG